MPTLSPEMAPTCHSRSVKAKKSRHKAMALKPGRMEQCQLRWQKRSQQHTGSLANDNTVWTRVGVRVQGLGLSALSPVFGWN